MILGAGISWTKGWVVFVWSIIKKCQGKNGVSNKLVVEVEHGLQLTKSWCSDKTDDVGPECTQGISMTHFGLTQENTLSSMSLRDITDGAKFILTMNNDMEILKDMFKEVYQELDEIKRDASQTRESFKSNNEQQKEMEKQIAKIDKKMEETIRLQHLETKRRFERLEKKTNAGYFN